MTDVIDRASEYEEQLLKDALARQQRVANLTDKTLADSAQECTDCGEVIPLKRRQAALGCQRCVECQHRLEMRR